MESESRLLSSIAKLFGSSEFHHNKKKNKLIGKLQQVCPHKLVGAIDDVTSYLKPKNNGRENYCTLCRKKFDTTSAALEIEFKAEYTRPKDEKEAKQMQKDLRKAKRILRKLQRMGVYIR